MLVHHVDYLAYLAYLAYLGYPNLPHCVGDAHVNVKRHLCRLC